jgi:hypothetical protein
MCLFFIIARIRVGFSHRLHHTEVFYLKQWCNQVTQEQYHFPFSKLCFVLRPYLWGRDNLPGTPKAFVDATIEIDAYSDDCLVPAGK